jgi:hypothetical protein
LPVIVFCHPRNSASEFDGFFFQLSLFVDRQILFKAFTAITGVVVNEEDL